MTRILLSLLLAGTALTIGHAAPAVLDIVYLGDSITYGAGLPDPATQAPPAVCSRQIQAQMSGVNVCFSNQGHGGHTTVDFLPSSNDDFSQAESAARKLLSGHPGQLVFTILLGTNDSAVNGTRGAPVSPENYGKNLSAIIDQLIADFPGSQAFIQQPIWYSPNTHNGATYEQPGLDRLNSYVPVIHSVVDSEERIHPGLVHLGDTAGYAYFQANYSKELQPENGRKGTFYLHPNVTGAASLGTLWAKAIATGLSRTPWN